MHAGEYEFTIDSAHPDQSIIDTNFSELDPEHKSFNIIALDNGQFAAQPNNRVIWRDNSLIGKLEQPDFKVCTQNYAVETEPKWWTVGHTDEWRYKPKTVLETSFGGTVEKNIPENAEWIDDAFYIKKTRFGLYTSILKEPLGQHFITGATYEGVLTMSRWHLKCLQDGTLDDYTRTVNSGVVGGKL